jgi:hypothetical protein
MGLYYGNKEIDSVFYGSKFIATIYKGSMVIWEAIKSCFGKGFWINSKGWNNKDGWKNN